MTPPNVQKVLELLPADWDSFTPENFARWLEEFDDIEIRFESIPLPMGFFGCSFYIVEEDEKPEGVVVVDANLSPTHREHVQLHELAHLALGHRTWTGTEEELRASLGMPSGLQQMLGTFTCRAPVNAIPDAQRQREEEEAELLTRLLAQRVFAQRQGKMLQRGSSQAELDEAMQRMGIAV